MGGGHVAGVTAVAFAHMINNDMPTEVVISGSADNSTRIWDLRTGTAVKVVQHPKTVFGIAVRPSGESVGDGLVPFARTYDDVIGSNTSSENGGEFVTACWDGFLRVFSLPTAVQTGELGGHSGGIYSVAYSPLNPN